MLRSRRGIVLALGFALLAVPAAALPAATDNKDAGGALALSGRILLPGGSLPAVWHYDEGRSQVLVDVTVSDELRTWMLLDWSARQPSGYVGREDGCFTFPLSAAARPTRGAMQSLTEGPAAEAETLDLRAIAGGLSAIRSREDGKRFLVLKEEQALAIFEIGGRATAPATVAWQKDVSKCRPMSELLDNLAGRSPSARDNASAGSLLQYNHPYTFRGLIYGWLTYKGQVFSQDKPAYDQALGACQTAGPSKCKPYWETGGAFGRYGYHCGDGWGSGSLAVSGQDYCCQLHDREAWGGLGKQAENLCGFAACMTCKYYVSLPDWEQNFRGDFWAQKVIAAFVGTGITFILCHPQNYLTGFTCN